MTRINHAYDMLGDPKKRAAYDEMRAARPSAGETETGSRTDRPRQKAARASTIHPDVSDESLLTDEQTCN